MKIIAYNDIVAAIRGLCIKGTTELPGDVLTALEGAVTAEASPEGAAILRTCVANAELARHDAMPICQDTGFAVFFVLLGDEVRIQGGLLTDAIAQGTGLGYTEGYLRASIVTDPLFNRVNTKNNTPPVVHLLLVKGDTLEIIFAPKGGGSENMSRIAMLKPTDDQECVAAFVTESVVTAGANPCPPVIVGVGIGGTFEYCAFLAKKALLRDVGSTHADPRYAALEREILKRINASGVGPQGLGGTQTALAVHIESFPCHIVSLPVAVNINCHVARHASVRW